MNLAIIIARGGSRRLPRKNVLPFCGHPLIAWSIVQAKISTSIDYTVMATDDDEIESIALEYGADEVIRHPVWEESAIRTFVYVLNEMIPREQFPTSIMAAVTMLPTSPLRLPGDLDRLVFNYYKVGAHTMTGMAKIPELELFHILTPYLSRRIHFEKHSENMVTALGATARSPGYILNHDAVFANMTVPALDKVTAAGLTETELFYTEVKHWQAQETDTADAFELCELLMEHYILKGKSMHEVYHV
jgi:hypothetical protein